MKGVEVLNVEKCWKNKEPHKRSLRRTDNGVGATKASLTLLPRASSPFQSKNTFKKNESIWKNTIESKYAFPNVFISCAWGA